MSRRTPAPEYRTTDSSAYEYLEERRTGKFRRVEVKFPLLPDRGLAGNTDYTDPTLHRGWKGEVPTLGRKNDEKSIRGAIRLDDPEFKKVSNIPNIKRTPEGYIGTPNGFEELINEPLTPDAQQGYPTDNPLVVDADFENDATEAEFVIGLNIKTENMSGERYPFRYSNPPPYTPDTRLSWGTNPEFNNPTSPEVRYPKSGAYKRKNSYSY